MAAADGPLPPLLIGLTVVSGLVDAVSYLGLGHVFVANLCAANHEMRDRLT